MNIGEKATEAAAPFEIDVQMFAGEEGAAGGDGGAQAPGATSSVIPGDDYASGGPEDPENQATRVDFGSFDFKAEPEEEPEEDPETSPEDDSEKKIDGQDPSKQQETVKPEQSPEQNAAFAEMRRKAEQAEKELAARDKWVEENFGATQNLHNWQQYQQAVEMANQQALQQRQQEMQTRPQQVAQEAYKQYLEAGYDEPVAREIANARGDAEAQKLQNQALAERLDSIEKQGKQQAVTVQKQAQQAAIQTKAQEIMQGWETERAKLQQTYGDMVPASMEQVGPEITEKLARGYSFEDAWLSQNHGKLMEQREKAAAQKTLNDLDSKKHLKTEGDGVADNSSGSIPLSSDTLAMYMDSGMTERQARAFHKKLYG